MAGDLNVSLIIRAIDRATAPIRKITNNFEQMRKASVRAKRAFRVAGEIRQAAEGVSRFARVARTAVFAPVKEFEDFQYAMAGVRAVSRGITDEEFKALTERAKELGATTRFTATQAAEGMRFLGMAGFTAAEQMQAIPATLDLATAASTDLGRTADIVSDIMGAFNKTAEETTAVSDMLAMTITSSNTTLETLFETMSYGGPVATAMKVPLQDVAAMAGLIGSAGIKGSRAGTTLNAMLTRLADPTPRATKYLKQFGIATGDAAGNLRPLPDILADVAKATADLGTKAKGTFVKEVFGIRALAGVSKLLTEVSEDKIRKFSAQIEKSGGATKEMARIMGDTARGATIRLTSAFSGLLTEIGAKLEPMLTSLKETLTSVVQSITGWVKRNPRLTKALATTALIVAAAATALSGLLFTLTTIVSAAGFASLAAGASATAASMLALAGPIGWIILALAALSAGAIILWQNWDKVVGIWERFKRASLATKIAIGLLLGPLLAIIAPLVAIGSAAKLIIENWEPIKEFFADLWAGIVEGAKMTLKVIGFLADPLNLIGRITGKSLTDVIGTAASAAAGTVGRAAREAAWVAGGGEAGAQTFETSEHLRRTGGETWHGETRTVIEFRNGIPVPVEQEASEGMTLETEYTGPLMGGALP